MTVNASTGATESGVGISQNLRGKLTKYGEIVEGVIGSNLAGLTAYGDGLDGAVETLSSVLVVRRVDLAQLRLLAERGPVLGNLGLTAPVVMTPAYIEASRDTFSLELMEIHQRKVTIAGEDHFASIAIEDEHLRLQCERELKRILIRLRQGVLAAGGREDVLAELELDVGLHLVRTIRGLMWLRGSRAFLSMEQAIQGAESLAGGSLDGARRAIRRSGEHDWKAFEALYGDVERLSGLVDGM